MEAEKTVLDRAGAIEVSSWPRMVLGDSYF